MGKTDTTEEEGRKDQPTRNERAILIGKKLLINITAALAVLKFYKGLVLICHYF